MRARVKSTPTVSLILILVLSAAQGGQVEKDRKIGPLPVAIAGDSNQTITVNGTQRSYILHIPPGYNSATRLPLVLVLHGMGRGQPAKSIEDQSGMSAKADQENFIVVYPSALGDPL